MNFLASYAYNIEEQTQFFDDLATFNQTFQWRNTDAARHRFTNAVTWDIPVGKGHWLFGSAPKAVDYIVGGWKFTNTSRFYSGRLLQFNQSLIVAGNPRLASPTRDKWFDTSQFSAVPTSDRSVKRTNAWNYKGVVGPKTFQTDMTMSKGFRLTEKFKLEARLEVYNLFNNINWDNPVVDFSSTNFGKVISKRAQYTGREVQYGLRVTF